MAIRPLDNTPKSTNKQLSYLSKDFGQWRQSLIDYAKVYFPQTYTDFNETSPGMMFIEMMAYLGDVLGYYIDSQFKENLLQYTTEQQNIIAIAQSLGFKPKPTSAAYTTADFYQLCPSMVSGSTFAPDPRYFLQLAPNTVVASNQFGNITFYAPDIIDFSNPLNRQVSVFNTNNSGQPLNYMLRTNARVVAGSIKSYSTTFGAPQAFSVVTIPDTNVIEVISVTDSNGFTWNEVDFLAQDLIITSNISTASVNISGQSVPPANLMQIQTQPRRFVTRYNSQWQLELHFGAGTVSDASSSVNLDPSQIASDEYNLSLASTALDPSDFLSSTTYGLAPANVTLTIQYTTGGGLASNVPSNTVNKIQTVSVTNNQGVFQPIEIPLFQSVVQSLAVNNPNAAIGGNDADSVEQIRQSALAFFNSQNRCVTTADYTARAYAMPGKYGAVAKVFVIQDQQINNIIQASTQLPTSGTFAVDTPGQNVVNMYVLGYDQNKNLVPLNQDIKTNLQTYLEQYRILTDTVQIIDAFVVTIGVDFEIIVYKNFNMNEVLTRCIDAVQQYFNVDNWQIQQPIILNDLSTTIGVIDGVQSVTKLEVVNLYQFANGLNYSPFIYDIASATINGVIYPSLDPMIWQIVNPSTDIVGSATS